MSDDEPHTSPIGTAAGILLYAFFWLLTPFVVIFGLAFFFAGGWFLLVLWYTEVVAPMLEGVEERRRDKKREESADSPGHVFSSPTNPWRTPQPPERQWVPAKERYKS